MACFGPVHVGQLGHPLDGQTLLPCYGTGTVTFAPYPTSPTARSATVQVTFVGQSWSS